LEGPVGNRWGNKQLTWFQEAFEMIPMRPFEGGPLKVSSRSEVEGLIVRHPKTHHTIL
jgi:hypothetical protein